MLKSESWYTLSSDLTQLSLYISFLLQRNLIFLTKNYFTQESPLQGDANRGLHLAVIHYVPNEQMKCLITVL